MEYFLFRNKCLDFFEAALENINLRNNFRTSDQIEEDHHDNNA